MPAVAHEAGFVGLLKLKLGIAALAFLAGAAEGRRTGGPLNSPALLNIGFVCRWDSACMGKQERAMNRALGYVRKSRPPAWKIQRCNRNASRQRGRVDWIGFNNCIRNPALRPIARTTTARR